MKKLFIAILAITLAIPAFAQTGRNFVIQVQNNGSTVGTASGIGVLNFTSGCTSTRSGGAFNILCSGAGTGTVAANNGAAGALAYYATAAGSTAASPNTLLNDSGSVFAYTGASGVAFGTAAQFTVNGAGLVTKASNLATAGQGFPIILGVTSQKSETTTADANVLTVTPAAAVGTYRACVVVSVSSATSGVVSWTLNYTDSNGNAQAAVAQPLFQAATAAPNVTFTTSAAGNYHGCAEIDVNNAAAAIIVKWVGGGTIAAKVTATIERII